MFIVRVALLIVSTTGMNERNNTISIIVSVPLYDCFGSQDINLKRGQDILTAAQAVVNGINNDSSILSKHHLQLLLFDSCEDEYEIIQQFVNITYYQSSHNARGLTGFLATKLSHCCCPWLESTRLPRLYHLKSLSIEILEKVSLLRIHQLLWPMYY